LTKKQIKIVGGPDGINTNVYIDGVVQPHIYGIKIDLWVDEPNRVTLIYWADVDIDIEADVIVKKKESN